MVGHQVPSPSGTTGDSANVFKNVSLSISKGSSIGIIGATGSGKTTLINLILGLITLTSGSIILNKRITKDNLNPLEGISGYIPQHIFLVDDTIKKNIALGLSDDEIDSDKVINAIINFMLYLLFSYLLFL